MTSTFDTDRMRQEKCQPMDFVFRRVRDDDFWFDYLNDNAKLPPTNVSIHLAVFIEPFLQYILEGKKTVESRFSINKCAPFAVVHEGDVLLLKRAGGPIVGISRVCRVWSYELDDESLSEMKTRFGSAMCAQNDGFWEERSSATCATLMQIDEVRHLHPFTIDKRDRRGWVVLQKRSKQLLLWND